MVREIDKLQLDIESSNLSTFISKDELAEQMRAKRWERLSVPPGVTLKAFLRKRLGITEKIFNIAQMFMNQYIDEIRIPIETWTAITLLNPSADYSDTRLMAQLRRVIERDSDVPPEVMRYVDSFQNGYMDLIFSVDEKAPAGVFSIRLKGQTWSNPISIDVSNVEQVFDLIIESDPIRMTVFTYLYLHDQIKLLTESRMQGERIHRLLPIYSSRPVTEHIWAYYASYVRALIELQHKDSTRIYSIDDIQTMMDSIEESEK